MIAKILVATDGSETAMKAVEYAVGLVKQLGATIILLSVIPKNFFLSKSIPAEATPTHLIEPIEDYLRRAAEAYIGEAEGICEENGIQSERLIRSGHIVEEIIRAAEESEVDLIVMGSHGNSAIKAAMLGSITFGVIHKDTKIPVLVVKK